MRRFSLLASAAVLFFSSAQAQIITPSGGGGSGSGITALTGDVTASGTGSVAATVVGAGGSTFSATTGQTYTFPTTTATLARTDAAQTFTGLQTFAGITLGSASTLAWSGSRGVMSSPAAAKVQFGGLDTAAPTAQFLKVQSVSTGTSNTAGTDWTLQGSTGTGTGTGGKIIFQTAPAGSTGTAQNAFTTQLLLDPAVTVAATSVLCDDAANSFTTTCSSTTPSFSSTTVSNLTDSALTATSVVCDDGSKILSSTCTSATPNFGATTISGAGASSVAALFLTGLPFVGTGTTSFPLVFVQPTGGTPPTASTTWSTSGTVFGANLHTGTLGNFLDLQIDGASKFSIGSGGAVITSVGYQLGGGSTITWSGRGVLTSPATGKIQLGNSDAATATAQSLKVQNVVAGTTDVAGGAWNIEGSQGTGTGVGGAINLRTAPAGTTGSAQNAEQTAVSIDQKSHVGYASAAIPTIGTCGTGSPTVTAGSTDNAGAFTVGTTATACTLTFKQTFTAAPFCVLNDITNTARLLSYTISTSALVLTMTSNSGDVVDYHCFGN